MNYTSSITVTADSLFDVKRLVALFSTEDRSFSNGRAQYDFSVDSTSLTFSVTASDPTSLRAVLNSIVKVLSVDANMAEVSSTQQ